MKEKQDTIDRRNFLKTVGAAGLSSVLASTGAIAGPNQSNAEEKPKYPQVPKRKLGKTKVKIPCLSFGTFQVDVDNQILLRKTLQYGVNFWDTAYSYGGGNSELGIGKFLKKNPKVRKNLFLVTKASGAKTPEEIEKRLKTSLERMNTDYIDLYYGLHQCPNPAWLTDEVRKWAESAKKRKLIRHFGITTHQNPAKVLTAASKLPWIEVIMTPFNFYLMQDPEMQAAIDACHKAGIGLIAMKVQGMGQKISTDADKKLVEHFLQRGFTKEQAKIKLVLEDKRFASACVGMKNVSVFNSNLAVAFDKTKLTQADRDVFSQYAKATCDGYCAGCADICNAVLPDTLYVSDIMRYLMYYNSYGEQAEARRLFAQIPVGVRNKLLSTDYSLAEARCPQRLPIRELVTEAVSKLT
ncbi:MAG: aldo/keto reductase [Planctomycetes bacterium]|nr:aldo/keto reductase [Planctomycetota bacterium]